MIGKMKLYEIDTVAVQKVINSLIDKNYSMNVIKKCKFLISQFFEYAIDNKWVTFNPTNKVQIRSRDRKIYDDKNLYKALPPEGRKKFLDALCEDEANFIKPLCICLMFAGLRIAEVIALKWNNVNFEKKTIKVERAITQVPKFDEKGNVIRRVTVVSETKTACSVREVPVTDIVIETLQKWKEKQHKHSFETGIELTKPNMFVFCNDDGSVRTYSGCRMIFDRFIARNHLEEYNIHFHGLRHTFSNMLFEMNENPKVIQQLLGHRDVKTTITVYNSVDNEYIREATEDLNKRIQTNNYFNSNSPKQVEKNNFTELSDEDLDEMLENLLRQKQARRKKEQDEEM